MARPYYVSVDGDDTTDQGDYVPAKSKGTHKVSCDLDTLLNFWMPTVSIKNLVQVQQGHKACLCCGEVRLKDRFDPDVSLGHGLIVALVSYADLMRSQRSTWLATMLHLVYRRRLFKGAIVLSPWCRQCVDEIAPTFKPTEVCSKCGQTKDRALFSADPERRNGLRSRCMDCEADLAGDYRRRKAEEKGRALRSYEYHIYTMSGLQQVV